MAGEAVYGLVSSGPDRSGRVCFGLAGMEGSVRFGTVRYGEAGCGKAGGVGLGSVRFGKMRHVKVRCESWRISLKPPKSGCIIQIC